MEIVSVINKFGCGSAGVTLCSDGDDATGVTDVVHTMSFAVEVVELPVLVEVAVAA